MPVEKTQLFLCDYFYLSVIKEGKVICFKRKRVFGDNCLFL